MNLSGDVIDTKPVVMAVISAISCRDVLLLLAYCLGKEATF